LLTIQLKRFDFDYESLHRIKLNDRITFPDFLDINGHIYRPPVPPSPSPPKISYAAAAAKLQFLFLGLFFLLLGPNPNQQTLVR